MAKRTLCDIPYDDSRILKHVDLTFDLEHLNTCNAFCNDSRDHSSIFRLKYQRFVIWMKQHYICAVQVSYMRTPVYATFRVHCRRIFYFLAETDIFTHFRTQKCNEQRRLVKIFRTPRERCSQRLLPCSWILTKRSRLLKFLRRTPTFLQS